MTSSATLKKNPPASLWTWHRDDSPASNCFNTASPPTELRRGAQGARERDPTALNNIIITLCHIRTPSLIFYCRRPSHTKRTVAPELGIED
jgi:hypothetical protein